MSHRILSVGEVLWDLLPAGPVLGGAPANFAVHAHGLGADARLVSRVGDDDRGREILRRLPARGMDTDLIVTDSTLPTGTVSVTLAGDGQPRYVIHEHVAWDAIAVTPESERAAAGCHAVCFGTLAQRSPASRAAVQALVAASPPDALRVFDLNLRQHFFSREVIEASLGLANVLKLNETELPVLAELFALRGKTEAQIARLAEEFELQAVAFTRGAQGSCLMVDGEWSDHRGIPAHVRDTVGAGDAFTAALVLGLLAHRPLQEIHEHASEVAAFVCSQTGPTPMLPEHLRASAGRFSNSSAQT
ncbi:MAG: carbohydrate kinase [Chthoniobacteraceae bacterium]